MKNILRIPSFLILAAVFFIPQFCFCGIGNGGSPSVMLQGFHWESHQTYPWWDVIADKASDIASSGFDLVWLPPSSVAASDEGYLPTRLYIQDSLYGRQDNLVSAIRALHSKGVKVLADIILNHRLGSSGWGDFTEPYWGTDAICSDDEWAGAQGAPDTGKGYHAARDIDHTKVYVQDSVKEWMNWLRTGMGYDGWRYDYVRGYAPEYVAMYNKASSPVFSVAEIWDDLDVNNPDAHRQKLCDWMDAEGGDSAVFDFTTKGILQHAVGAGEYWRLRDSNGRPSGLIGRWPANAVTFIDNHDTGASTGGPGQNLWPFPADRVMRGYAYILTHPGIPCVYWPHFFDWGLREELKNLMRLRKAAGITSASRVIIQAADSAKYAAVINKKLAMKIGPGEWSPGTGWKLAASGKDYAVWLLKKRVGK
ncbi:MAG: alpha-amylase C-terminal beta-sheet domain-containing protein [bacterium]